MWVYNFFIIFGTVIIIWSLIVGIKNLKEESSNIFKVVLSFIIIGLLISANTFFCKFFHITPEQTFKNIQRSLNTLQYLIILYIITLLFYESSFLKKIIVFLVVIVTLITIFIFIKTLNSNNFFYIHIAPIIVILFSCLLYYYQLFKNNFKTKLVNSPEFWIVVGLTFYSSISFPVFTLYKYINTELLNNNNLFLAIYSLGNFALIILYICFIKSFLCLKHKSRHTY